MYVLICSITKSAQGLPSSLILVSLGIYFQARIADKLLYRYYVEVALGSCLRGGWGLAPQPQVLGVPGPSSFRSKLLCYSMLLILW